MFISEEMKNLLQQQIAHENENANLYFKIGSVIKNMGLDILGDFFYSQADGECGHKKIVMDYLTDRNANFDMLGVQPQLYSFNGLVDLGEKYLAREQSTTEKIKAIVELAFNEDDHITREYFMRTLISEQREEEGLAQTFLDCAKLADNDFNKFLKFFAKYLSE